LAHPQFNSAFHSFGVSKLSISLAGGRVKLHKPICQVKCFIAQRWVTDEELYIHLAFNIYKRQ